MVPTARPDPARPGGFLPTCFCALARRAGGPARSSQLPAPSLALLGKAASGGGGSGSAGSGRQGGLSACAAAAAAAASSRRRQAPSLLLCLRPSLRPPARVAPAAGLGSVLTAPGTGPRARGGSIWSDR